jgi:broad specificity phosphatase PhoE
MTTLVIVRHGHTAINDGDRFRGITDTPLSELGLQQSRRTAEEIAGRWRLSAVYTSSVVRARMTALEIGSPFGLEPVDDPGLYDMDYGEWTGLSFEDARMRDAKLFRTCMERPGSFRAPGGQSFEELRGRSMAAALAIAERHEDQAVAIVSHTVIVRLLLLAILGMPTDSFWKLRPGTCALNVVSVSRGGCVLDCINDGCHVRSLAGKRAATASLT